jgi:acetylornithine/succinyldiaminopimelate/putrescine aminotransferase
MKGTNKELFSKYVAQTSDYPINIEIIKAIGTKLYDVDNNIYTDIISGICVNNFGHRHPKIVKAIKDQLDRYMHLMVYGELIQEPQVLLCEKLAGMLPPGLNSVYIVNSGSEAVEGALKLAKRVTGRTEIVGFKNAYHGGTTGALSLMGDEYFRNAYRPLLPDIRYLNYNTEEELEQITQRTACVLIEPIQAEAGIIMPDIDYLQKLADKCKKTGTLLIFDEVQTGIGRTGKNFAFEHFGVVPDILILGKGLGGGMPIGAFISSVDHMNTIRNKPVLGHITTFGGHPLTCAAACAALDVLNHEIDLDSILAHGAFIKSQLNNFIIKDIRGIGLFLGVELKNSLMIKKFLNKAFQNGLFTNAFIFNPRTFRFAPPLIIQKKELGEVCTKINAILGQIS